MTTEQNNAIWAREFAEGLRVGPQPRCPQFRACHMERLYPVEGYCVLVKSPGQLMTPSIEEYREFCKSSRFGDCCWFRGTGESRGPGKTQAGERPARAELWQPPDVVQPIRGQCRR